MIVAKPVIANQFWILKQDNNKVGNIEAGPNGYTVTIQDHVINYKTIPMVRKAMGVEFEAPEKVSKPANDQVHGYHTGCRAHNGMWDVKHKLPLFTKTTKSKSWFAAGYYWVKQHRTWKVVSNPKLIVLERYPFKGPFHSRTEAEQTYSKETL